MALTLRLRSGGITPAPELQFDAARLVVGRAAGCELQLPDPSVSPRHASIRRRGSDYVVLDEGSENGTFSGSERLVPRAPHTLRDGELLRFGRVWVEVRLAVSQATTDAGASRELARRLVEQALAADGAPYGMTVARGGDAAEGSVRLDQPRQSYVVGSLKSAALRLTGGGLPARAVELRRQGDQLWLTLIAPELAAQLDERALTPGERVAWPRASVLTLGEHRLTFADPTAQILERLERGRTEILSPDEPVEPPEGSRGTEADEEAPDEDEDEDGAGEDEDGAGEDDESEVHDLSASPTSAGPARRANGGARPGADRSKKRTGSWTSLDAVVFMLALAMLGLSLWAIRWLAFLSPTLST